MIRRITAAAAAGAAGLVLTGAIAGTAAAAPLGGGTTPVEDCAQQTVTEPTDIIMTCGDANSGFKDIRWYLWTDQVAIGTAHKFWNTCDPSCAAGTMREEGAWIALHTPAQSMDGQRAFSTVSMLDGQGVRTSTLPGFPFAGQYLFP